MLVGIGVVLGLFVAWNNPYIDDRVEDLLVGEPNFSGEEIQFTRSQLDSVSEVYRDVQTEYGWCLRVEESTVESLDHFNDLEYSTEVNASFSCDSEFYNGIVHTHPGAYGSERLSATDRETLTGSEWIDVSCVVADPVQELTQFNPRGIACYNEEDGEVQRLQVEVDEDSG
jgi:proteasome lid subunit RPN8/RPN11